MNLSLEDLPRVFQQGIDSVWEHDGHYTVLEAKGSASVGTAYGGGKRAMNAGTKSVVAGLNPNLHLLHCLLNESNSASGSSGSLTQMSKEWVRSRAPNEQLTSKSEDALIKGLATRRVVLVTLESSGASDHASALIDINLGKGINDRQKHDEHGITQAWDGDAIDTVVRARARAQKARTPTSDNEKPKKSLKGKK